MKTHFIYIAFLITPFLSCHAKNDSNDPKEISLRSLGSISFDIEHGQAIKAKQFKTFYVNDTSIYLCYYDYNKSMFYRHLLNNRFTCLGTDTIRISNLHFKRGYKNFLSYNIISKDSILIFLNPSYASKYYTHDSSLYVINSKGDLLKSFDMEQIPVTTWAKAKAEDYNRGTIRQNNPYIMMYSYSPLVYDHKRRSINIPLARYSTVTNAPMPDYGYLNIDNETYTVVKGTAFRVSQGEFYTRNIEDPRSCYNPIQNITLLGFGNNNRLTILDNQTFKRKEVNVSSYIMDSILPYNQYYDAAPDYNRGHFIRMVYDRYNDAYINVYKPGNYLAGQSVSDTASEQAIREVDIFQYIDKDLNLIGEGIIPATYWDNLQPAFGKYLIFNEKKSIAEQRIIFDIVELEFAPTTISNFKNKVADMLAYKDVNRNTAYEAYIKALNVQRPSKDYLVVNFEKNCPSCIKAFTDHYRLHKDAFAKADLNIVLIASSKSFVLDKLGLKMQPQNLLIDDAAIYAPHLGEVTDFDWVEFDKEGVKNIHKYDASGSFLMYSRLEPLLK